MHPSRKSNLYVGVSLAVIATIIWSGNFVIARGVTGKISPISLNFFRWLTATVLLFPFAIKICLAEKELIVKNGKYFLLVSLTCILLFNSFVYIAGQYTTVINLALIGTTSSPVFTIALAWLFFKEAVRPLRVLGMAICLMGILVLLSQGSLQRLLAFHFSRGDWWILAGSFFFAVYNVLVKRKPAGISPLVFLFVFFLFGTLLLTPFFIWEQRVGVPLSWDLTLMGIVLYLGLGTSLLAYLCWNAAILRIGSTRTALFGNLIPIFSSVEAVLILQEKIQMIHLISGLLVITGLVVANLKKANSIP